MQGCFLSLDGYVLHTTVQVQVHSRDKNNVSCSKDFYALTLAKQMCFSTIVAVPNKTVLVTIVSTVHSYMYITTYLCTLHEGYDRKGAILNRVS